MSKRTATETWRLEESDLDLWRRHSNYFPRMNVVSGEALYLQGNDAEYFFVVVSGKIEVIMLRDDGTQFTIDVMGPGAVCGEAGVFEGLPYFASAYAVAPSTVLRVSLKSLKQAAAEDLDIAFSVMRIMAVKQRIMSHRAQSMAVPESEIRIGELLKRIVGTYGEESAGGMVLPFILTHEQIGLMTGTSRVTVTRAIKRLKSIGAVRIDQRRLVILNSDLLA